MNKVKVRIYEINYDTDGDEELKESLPKEIETYIEINGDITDKNEIVQEVSDYITGITGFCHYSFLFDII